MHKHAHFLNANYRTGRTGRSQSLPVQGVGNPVGISNPVGPRVIDGMIVPLVGMGVAVGMAVMVGYGLVVGKLVSSLAGLDDGLDTTG